MNLYTDEEFARRFVAALGEIREETFTLTVEHEERETIGPRASSLASCARQQFYSITGHPVTNPTDKTSAWPQLMGYTGQAVAAMALRRMGYEILDEEKTVSLGELISGHMDGVLTGLDLGDGRAVWDNKMRNVYALHDWVKLGLPEADVSAYLQLQTYMAAESYDLAIITVLPFDLSAAKWESFKKRKLEVAEPLINRIVIEADAEAQELAINRGRMLGAAVAMNVVPAREFDPGNPKDAKFPCGWCEWAALCAAEGQTRDFVLPPIPFEWRKAA